MQLDRRAHQRSRWRHRRWRTVALPATLAASVALAVAGCGGSAPTTAPTSTGAGGGARAISPDAIAGGSAGLRANAVKFSKCMRAHGVPNFPDPSSDGQLTIKGTGINTNSPVFKGAQSACQSLRSGPGGVGPSGQKSDMTAAQALALAKCMRAHGDPNFPDPSSSGVIPPNSVNLSSPAVQSAFQACQSASGSSASPWWTT